MNFAEHLMTLRKQRGWSQEELGNQIGVTRQTVSKWEMGQSTPELEKLVELARLFNMSIDRLVGLEGAEERGGDFTYQQTRAEMRSLGVYYEYSSPVKVFGLPVVHIRLGFGPRLAKGIVAIGNCAVGVVAVGGGSLGVISIGGISLGLLFAFGGLSLGLVTLGGVAIGGFAVGGCAIGQWLAAGGGALSNYLSIGGGAVSSGLAIGGSAFGHIAVGTEEAKGAFAFLQEGNLGMEEVWSVVKQEFPHMWDWVRSVIQWVLR
ncbi:MAG: helix-turn-helix transcriptional regulator [Lawsonibacter sp.]|nr:helix-turn-helix transcriptional regulator [Lawsonibacter sp.]